jgi:MFS family permease
MNCSISIYGFSFAAPTIIKQLGYTSAEAQLMTIPIYVVGALSTVIFARLADKQQKRWLFIVIPFSIALVGFIGVLAIPHPRLPGLTYAFLFLITGGLYPSLIGCVSWVGNNLAPSFKRAIGLALLMTVGGLGGAVGSNIFLQEQAPNYWVGYGVCAFIVAASIVSALILQWATKCINRKRDLVPEEQVRAQYTEGQYCA